MRHYEIMLLVHPDQSEQIGAIHDRYQKMVQDGKGKVHRFEDWGRLSLAYRIVGAQKGHYVLLNIEVDYPTLQQVRESLTLNEQVLRFLVVRKEQAETGASQALENLSRQRNERNDRKGRPFRDEQPGESKSNSSEKPDADDETKVAADATEEEA